MPQDDVPKEIVDGIVNRAFENTRAVFPDENTHAMLLKLAQDMQTTYERAISHEGIDFHLTGCRHMTGLGLISLATNANRGIDDAAFVVKGEDIVYLSRVPYRRQVPQIHDHEVLHVVMNRLGLYEESKALDSFDGGTFYNKPNPWGSWSLG